MLPSRKAFVRTSSASELNSAARLMLAIIVSDSDAHPPSRCAKSSQRSATRLPSRERPSIDVLRGLFVARALQCLGREPSRAVFADDRAASSVRP